jgi:hypothetical protein
MKIWSLKLKKRYYAGEIFQSVISNARKFKISGNKLSFYKNYVK